MSRGGNPGCSYSLETAKISLSYCGVFKSLYLREDIFFYRILNSFEGLSPCCSRKYVLKSLCIVLKRYSMQTCVNIMFSYRFLVFVCEPQEPPLGLGPVSTLDLQGGYSPTLTLMWALSDIYSKPQRIPYKKGERSVDAYSVFYFSDSFPHP